LCIGFIVFNPLNAKLNPICHLLALAGAHHFVHVSRIRVKKIEHEKYDLYYNLRLLFAFILLCIFFAKSYQVCPHFYLVFYLVHVCLKYYGKCCTTPVLS
jgi:phosphatidylserine synthase